MLDSLTYVKTIDNRKYVVKIFKPGVYDFWVRGSDGIVSSRKIEIQMDSIYYMEVKLNKVDNNMNAQLLLLNRERNIRRFDNISAEIIPVNYPAPRTKDIPFATKQTAVNYYSLQDTLSWGSLRLYVPNWGNCVEYVPFYGFVLIGYYDPLVSATYSELAKITVERWKKARSQDELDAIVLKIDSKDYEFLAGQKVIYRERVELPVNWKYYHCEYIISHDTVARNRGVNSYLEMHTYKLYLYLDIGKKGKEYQVVYSQRGVPGELHDPEAFQCRMLDFVNKIENAEGDK
jgi:hypothetical protein